MDDSAHYSDSSTESPSPPASPEFPSVLDIFGSGGGTPAHAEHGPSEPGNVGLDVESEFSKHTDDDIGALAPPFPIYGANNGGPPQPVVSAPVLNGYPEHAHLGPADSHILHNASAIYADHRRPAAVAAAPANALLPDGYVMVLVSSLRESHEALREQEAEADGLRRECLILESRVADANDRAASARAELQADVAAARAEIDSLRSRHRAELDGMASAHRTEIARLDADHATERARLTAMLAGKDEIIAMLQGQLGSSQGHLVRAAVDAAAAAAASHHQRDRSSAASSPGHTGISPSRRRAGSHEPVEELDFVLLSEECDALGQQVVELTRELTRARNELQEQAQQQQHRVQWADSGSSSDSAPVAAPQQLFNSVGESSYTALAGGPSSWGQRGGSSSELIAGANSSSSTRFGGGGGVYGPTEPIDRSTLGGALGGQHDDGAAAAPTKPLKGAARLAALRGISLSGDAAVSGALGGPPPASSAAPLHSSHHTDDAARRNMVESAGSPLKAASGGGEVYYPRRALSPVAPMGARSAADDAPASASYLSSALRKAEAEASAARAEADSARFAASASAASVSAASSRISALEGDLARVSASLQNAQEEAKEAARGARTGAAQLQASETAAAQLRKRCAAAEAETAEAVRSAERAMSALESARSEAAHAHSHSDELSRRLSTALAEAEAMRDAANRSAAELQHVRGALDNAQAAARASADEAAALRRRLDELGAECESARRAASAARAEAFALRTELEAARQQQYPQQQHQPQQQQWLGGGALPSYAIQQQQKLRAPPPPPSTSYELPGGHNNGSVSALMRGAPDPFHDHPPTAINVSRRRALSPGGVPIRGGERERRPSSNDYGNNSSNSNSISSSSSSGSYYPPPQNAPQSPRQNRRRRSDFAASAEAGGAMAAALGGGGGGGGRSHSSPPPKQQHLIQQQQQQRPVDDIVRAYGQLDRREQPQQQPQPRALRWDDESSLRSARGSAPSSPTRRSAGNAQRDSQGSSRDRIFGGDGPQQQRQVPVDIQRSVDVPTYSASYPSQPVPHYDDGSGGRAGDDLPSSASSFYPRAPTTAAAAVGDSHGYDGNSSDYATSDYVEPSQRQQQLPRASSQIMPTSMSAASEPNAAPPSGGGGVYGPGPQSFDGAKKAQGGRRRATVGGGASNSFSIGGGPAAYSTAAPNGTTAGGAATKHAGGALSSEAERTRRLAILADIAAANPQRSKASAAPAPHEFNSSEAPPSPSTGAAVGANPYSPQPYRRQRAAQQQQQGALREPTSSSFASSYGGPSGAPQGMQAVLPSSSVAQAREQEAAQRSGDVARLLAHRAHAEATAYEREKFAPYATEANVADAEAAVEGKEAALLRANMAKAALSAEMASLASGAQRSVRDRSRREALASELAGVERELSDLRLWLKANGAV